MLVNIVVLVILAILATTILSKTSTSLGIFWRNLLQSPIRTASIAIIIMSQRGIWAKIIAVCIFLGVTYYLVNQRSFLIDWRDNKVQKASTAIMVFFAIISIFNITEIVSILFVVVVSVFIAIMLYLINNTDS